MSAAVCGSKRSFFEDIPSPPSSKRIRYFSPSASPNPSSSLDQLRSAFPHLEIKVLVSALEECGSDLDAAMNSLHSTEEKPTEELAAGGEQGGFAYKENPVVAGGNLAASDNLPRSGDDWVELLVREMTQSSSKDDAKARAARVLEALEKAISAHAHEEAGKTFQEENMGLRQQLEALIKDNAVLKRAVAIQHERQKVFDDVNQQLEFLKQLIPQYQEKLRTLEVNNYALRMHLQQAGQSGSVPERFNPDVF